MILILKCKCTQTRCSVTVPSNWRLEEAYIEDKKDKGICSQNLQINRLSATCPVCLKVEQCEKENKKDAADSRV